LTSSLRNRLYKNY